jgi:hypothetical protein
MWLHASPSPIADGDYVLPRNVTKQPAYGGIAYPDSRADRVYVFCDLGLPVEQHLDRFAFIRRDGYVYEVESEEPSEADPAFHEWRSCARAKVLRCAYSPI